MRNPSPNPDPLSPRVTESSSLVPATPEPLWKPADVARYLNLTEAAVFKRVERGDLPAIRLGRTLRFDPAAIRAFVAERTVSVKAHALTGVDGPTAKRYHRPAGTSSGGPKGKGK